MIPSKQPLYVHLCGLIAAIICIPWEGFVIAKLWLWFMVPLGAPGISWAAGAGLSLLAATLLLGKAFRKIADEGMGYAVSCLTAPAMSLLFGWLIHRAEVSHFLR